MRLNALSSVDLFKIQTCDVSSYIKDAMRLECTGMWLSHKNASFAHEIFHSWNPKGLTRSMYSKITTTWYYQIRSGQSMLRSFTCKYKNLSKCRYGCNVLEDPSHIFFECTHLTKYIQNIKQRC